MNFTSNVVTVACLMSQVKCQTRRRNLLSNSCCNLIVVLVKVEQPFLEYGSTVQVIEDLVEVQKLQKNHGGWVDNMTEVRVKP